MSERKKILLLGCTGSIGQQTLDVIASHKSKLQLTGVVAYSNIEKMSSQASYFGVPEERRFVVSAAPSKQEAAKHLEELIASDDTDIVVNAMSGAAGLRASYQTLQHDKILALANKESLVVGGDIIMPLAHQRQVEHGGRPEDIRLLPIDSEHGAIFQCLVGEQQPISNSQKLARDVNENNIEMVGETHKEVTALWVTASGGPFRNATHAELAQVKAADALKHPTWNMGPKITIDSASMMNKGLEVIEAHHLFGMPYDRIKVVVQPQSAIHSMVEFTDGSVKAHLGPTDMRIPIQYSLSFPERWGAPAQIQPLDFTQLGVLEFAAPDLVKFPLLATAYEAGKRGGLAPCVMNAANEVAVAAFLQDKISFTAIAEVVQQTLQNFLTGVSSFSASSPVESLDQLEQIDAWARQQATKLL